jgi:hypothetical protein
MLTKPAVHMMVDSSEYTMLGDDCVAQSVRCARYGSMGK